MEKKKMLVMTMIACSVMLFGMFAGCLGDSEDDDSKIENPGGTTIYNDSIEEVNNRFAFEMYSQLRLENPGENVFFSPWSVTVAMGMTYEGARGNTAKQMEDVLHIPKNDTVRWNAFQSLQNEINGESDSYELHSANAYWGDDEIDFRQEYLDILVDYYQAEARILDLNGDPQGSTDTINEWVESKTNEKIKDLLKPSDFDANTALVLTNAIYFKANWKYQFETEDTTEMDFWKTPDESVMADMMRMLSSEETFNYYENDDLQALELAYTGDELSMIIILPKENDISTLDDYLSSGGMEQITDNMTGEPVDIYLPKFKFEQKYRLETTLADMGMPDAFTGGVADLTGLSDTDYGFWIDQVNHKAFVEVNEEGTEAAAATAVVVTYESAEPDQSHQFKADHPFLFYIKQNSNDNILFLGQVTDPTA